MLYINLMHICRIKPFMVRIIFFQQLFLCRTELQGLLNPNVPYQSSTFESGKWGRKRNHSAVFCGNKWHMYLLLSQEIDQKSHKELSFLFI